MRINESIKFLSILLVMIIMISSAHAQYAIKNSVMGSGFGLMSNTENKINSTTGQSFIGKIDNTTYINQSGFWYSGYLVTGMEELNPILPGTFKLYQNYPNPFNPSTTIKYDLKTKTDIKLTIYNLLGQKVKTLVNANQAAGYQDVLWNGLNELGEQVSTGVYIYRIEADGFVKSRKMVFMK